jgi:hypothetical protein
MHAAGGSSRWGEPDLERKEDQDSTYPDERHGWRNIDPDDGSRGSTRMVDDSRRRKPDFGDARMALSEGERRRCPSRRKREREGDQATDEDSDESFRNSYTSEEFRDGRVPRKTSSQDVPRMVTRWFERWEASLWKEELGL